MSKKIKKSISVLELQFTPKQHLAVLKAFDEAVKVNSGETTYVIAVQPLVDTGRPACIKVNFLTKEFADELVAFLNQPRWES